MNTLNIEQLVTAYTNMTGPYVQEHGWDNDMYVITMTMTKDGLSESGMPLARFEHGYDMSGLGWHKAAGYTVWNKMFRAPGMSLGGQHSKTRVGEQIGIYKGRQKLLCMACLPNGNEHVYQWVEKIYQSRPDMFGIFGDSVRMGKQEWSKQDVQNLQRVHDRLVAEQDERELLEADSRPFILLPEISDWKRIKSGSELKALAKEFKNCCFSYLEDCVEGLAGFYRVEWEGNKICVCVQYMNEDMGLLPWTKYEVYEAKYPCNTEPSKACMEYLNNIVWNIERL